MISTHQILHQCKRGTVTNIVNYSNRPFCFGTNIKDFIDLLTPGNVQTWNYRVPVSETGSKLGVTCEVNEIIQIYN